MTFIPLSSLTSAATFAERVSEEVMDRISLLEDTLILRILSNLPHDKVASTCVLSKRWEHLWKKASKVDVYLRRGRPIGRYEEYNPNLGAEESILFAMMLNVYRVLLETVRLHVAQDVVKETRFEVWLGMAVKRSVRELELDIIDNLCQPKIRIDASFYRCETIVKLKLRNICLTDCVYRVCLKSLKTLELDSVRYEDEASVSRLVSGCPTLEELVMYRASAVNDDLELETFTINVTVPSLLRLRIHDFNYGEEGYTRIYVINTPSLKHFEVAGFEDFHISFVQIPLELVEANARGLRFDIEEKLLHSLSSATRLSLASYPHPSIDNTVFHRLVDLELSTNEESWWVLFTSMIDLSPTLRILRLIGPQNFSTSLHVLPRTWIEPKNAPTYLETLVWKSYTLPQVKEEKEAVKYLIRNGNRLKRASIFCSDLNRSEEKIELLKELTNVVRPANSCELLLN